MMLKSRVLRSLLVAVISVVVAGGIVWALVQITEDVGAIVTLEVRAPDGIEVYLDEGLETRAETIAFAPVQVDVFGTVSDSEDVPVWVYNRSLSAVQVSLDDDLDLADVVFEGAQEGSLVEPDGVLPGTLSLEFGDGVPGTFDFTIFFQAEGPIVTPTPIPEPTPTPEPVTVAEFQGRNDHITEPFSITRVPWKLNYSMHSGVQSDLFLLDVSSAGRIKTVGKFQGTGEWLVFDPETIGTFRMEIQTIDHSWSITITE